MDITSVHNSKIKYIRSLHQTKHRNESHHFLIEGQKLFDEAWRSAITFRDILVLDRLTAPSALQSQCVVVSENVMNAATTLNSPPPILAVAEQYQLLFEVKSAQLLLLCEGLQDPGNFGALLRLAEAFGVNAVVCLGEHVDVFHPRVLRGAMGAVFRLPVVTWSLTQVQDLALAGWQMVATTSHDGIPLQRYLFSPQTCLFMGSEGQGLSAELMAISTAKITIPLAETVESLNVATATAVILYEYQRQQVTHHA